MLATVTVPVAASGAFPFGAPTRLFHANVEFTQGLGRILNVSADGRFLLKTVSADRVPPPIVVVHDWASQLPR